MSNDPIWKPLVDELDRWRLAGRQPRFWLRDDDAIVPTDLLDRLLATTAKSGVPLALAVIPAHTDEQLASRLSSEPHATVLVHGWAHENHAPEGQKKQELGLHRPEHAVGAELAAGLALLQRLHGPNAAPVLVPPWNRIDRALIPLLPQLGFSALSVFGQPFPAPLAIVNSTVDIIDWHGTRGGRDHGVLVGEIVAQLQADFSETSAPIGILSHHLVHDDAAWTFLEELFAVTNKHAPGAWLPVTDLISQGAVSRRP